MMDLAYLRLSTLWRGRPSLDIPETLILSLSKDEGCCSWFDRLTMSGFGRLTMSGFDGLPRGARNPRY
jgi:hypothetical protein